MRREPALLLSLAGVATALAVGCGPGPTLVNHETGPGPAPLQLEVEPAALRLVDAGPFFGEEGPPIVARGAGGVIVEGSSVEVRTAYCDPADLALVLDEDIPTGTVLDLTLTHGPLIADGGEAHLAVVLGDEIIWEQRTPLPAPAAFLSPRAPDTRDHAAGERLVVHMHNHGSNAYALRGLSLRAP